MAPSAALGRSANAPSSFAYRRCLQGAQRGCSRARCAPVTRAVAEPPVKTAPGSNGATATEEEPGLKENILQNLLLTGSSTHIEELSAKDLYRGVAQSVRQKLVAAFNRTQEYWRCDQRPPHQAACKILVHQASKLARAPDHQKHTPITRLVGDAAAAG